MLKKIQSKQIKKREKLKQHERILYFQHAEGPFIPDAAPFTPIWGQDPAPPIVPYPELMGFPCSDLGD